ncbi:DUF5916 domain-containing protein [Marinicella sp. W31]|uniref:carbohydrate binding family 9 domain-containing protein n=1 Tax=Marinicella sp. W31 TaxID=3023713 RepID=UPI00375814AA
MKKIKLMVFLCWCLTGFAQTEFPSVQLTKITEAEKPVIDGLLNEAIWERVERIDDFHQIRPTDGGAPSQKTEVQVMYDADFVYVALRAYDDAVTELGAKGLIQGQPFFSDDRFEVRFDTFNDRRNSYFFQVNANGIRREALVGNEYFIDEWDTVWFAEAEIHDWGWSVEMAIPVKSIAFDPSTTTWGLNFSRVYPRAGEEMSWSSRERGLGPAVSGYAEGISGLEQGLGVELVPSIAFGYNDSKTQGSDTNIEPSLTGFYNITPFLTAGLTLNTDFSATEVDERQVNLSRFSLFFPEKRDFFLRDASIFEFGNLGGNGRPFFSRRIGLGSNGNPLGIDAGVKLSGRAGNWNLGALAIQQEAGVAGGDELLFVGRATRNVQKESEFGFIATQGDPSSVLNNRLLGVDYTYRKSDFLDNQRLRANLWYQRTDTDGIEDRQQAYGGRITYPNDRFNGYLEWRRIEDNFNPALGFVNRTGVEQVDGMFRHRHRLDDSFWQWLGARVQFSRSDRIDGGVQSESAYLNFFEGFSQGNDFFTFYSGQETEGLIEPFSLTDDIVIPTGLYKFNRYGVYIETGLQRPVALILDVTDGDFFGGSNLLIAPSLEWRPNKHFFASISRQENRIRLPQGNVNTKLYSARFNVAFNKNWAWLNLIQGDNLSHTMAYNSRLRFQPRPDREYFLVINHSRDSETNESLETSIALKASFNLRF